MKRRDFVIGLVGGVAASTMTYPAVARPQRSAMPVIGFLGLVMPGPFAGELAGFRKGLAESGFVEGQNLSIVYRWADNNVDRLPALAADLVKRQVQAIVVGGGLPSVLAVKAATSTIPILFTGAGDPVKLGLIASLNRPGGNLTGVSFVAVELVAKRVELLRELLPNAGVVAVVSTGRDPEEAALAKTAARAMGLRIEILTAVGDSDLEGAFATMAMRRVDAAVIGTNPTFVNRRAKVIALAARHAIPTIYARREYVTDGGLISYSPPVTDAYRQVGIYTARILRGTKPADLPVMQPTKFELTVNLKTARSLGIAVPPNILARADEVIE